jgi:hypothetical protein
MLMHLYTAESEFPRSLMLLSLRDGRLSFTVLLSLRHSQGHSQGSLKGAFKGALKGTLITALFMITVATSDFLF